MSLLRNIRPQHSLRLQKVTDTRYLSKITYVHPVKKQHRDPLQVIQDAGLRLRLATVEDAPAIIDLMREYFYKEEPIIAAMEVVTSGFGTECKSMDAYIICGLHQNVSVVCEPADGTLKGLAAALTCCITEKFHDDLVKKEVASARPLEPLSPTAGPEERNLRIDRFIDRITAEADVFSLYPQLDKLMDSIGIVVHPRYRQVGVARALIEDIARANGLHLVRSYTASPYTLAICKALGRKCIHRLPYSKFLDSEGNQIIRRKVPHLDEVYNNVLEVDLEKDFQRLSYR